MVVFNKFHSPECRKPRFKQKSARDFFLFKYFLNNQLLIVLVQNFLVKLVSVLQLKVYNSLLEKSRLSFCTAAAGNVCANFKVDRLSRFLYWILECALPEETFPWQNSSNRENCNLKYLLNTFSDQITNG